MVYLSDGVVLKKQNNTSEIGCEEVGVRPVAAFTKLHIYLFTDRQTTKYGTQHSTNHTM